MFYSEERTRQRKANIEKTYKVIADFCKRGINPKYVDLVVATGFAMHNCYSYVDQLSCAGLVKINRFAKEHTISLKDDTEDEECKVFTLEVGDIIRVKGGRDIYGLPETARDYRILKFYPYIVLTEDVVTKAKRCFNLGDMIVMGYANQPIHVKAIKERWG